MLTTSGKDKACIPSIFTKNFSNLFLVKGDINPHFLKYILRNSCQYAPKSYDPMKKEPDLSPKKKSASFDENDEMADIFLIQLILRNTEF